MLSQLHITHVIFDLDGTLIDTESLYQRAMLTTLNSFKKEVPSEVLDKACTFNCNEACTYIISKLNLDVSEEVFKKKYMAEAQKVVKDNNLLPGAEKLVRHLSLFKIPMVLATSSNEKLYGIKIKKHMEFFKLFNIVVYGTDPSIKKSKPAPDIYRVAYSRFIEKPPKEDVLVFEDTANGVKAASAADLQCILITQRKLKFEERKLACLVVQSLEEINLQNFGLPPIAHI